MMNEIFEHIYCINLEKRFDRWEECQKEFEKLIELVFEKELLSTDGMLVVEHSKRTKLNHMNHFSFEKNYGGSVFTFYEFEKTEDQSEEEDENDN